MCGRFNIKSTPALNQLVKDIGVSVQLQDQFNIAPTEQIPIFHIFEGQRACHLAKWWLTPSWAKEPDTKFSMFNARSETLESSRAFKEPFKHKRCVIPATSFVEWQKGPEVKIPVELYREAGALAFAGLWDVWRGELLSCTILTTDASEEIAPIHNRMPVMLDQDGIELWLSDTQQPSELKGLFSPKSPYSISSRMVDPSINNSRIKEMPRVLQ